VYEILLLSAAQKDLDNLETSGFSRIIKKIRSLSADPRPPGSLKLTDEEGYRIRIGDHRVLYRIDDASKRVYIYRIRPRKDAYS
jgi:mRNA interferase RelE/StbE